MAPIFKYAFPIFKYRPDIQISEYVSQYFHITLAFQIREQNQIFTVFRRPDQTIKSLYNKYEDRLTECLHRR